MISGNNLQILSFTNVKVSELWSNKFLILNKSSDAFSKASAHVWPVKTTTVNKQKIYIFFIFILDRLFMRIKRSSLKEVCTLNFNVYYLEVQSLKKFYLNLNNLLETVKNLKISPYTVFNKCYALSCF